LITLPLFLERFWQDIQAFLHREIRMRKPEWVLILVIIAAIGWIIFNHHYGHNKALRGELVLLLPNQGWDQDSVSGWQNIAAEEGVPLTILHDSEFLNANTDKITGLMIPDSIHKIMNIHLVTRIKKYVQNGGKLFLTYDAGTLTPNGAFYEIHSPFSDAVGIDYANYSLLGNGTTSVSYVGAEADVLDSLGIPPGKYATSYTCPCPTPHFNVITTYGYGGSIFPHFTTTGQFKGQALLQSPNGQLIAGISQYGNGSILFVNTPLTYLWKRSDGLLLHTFIKFFANDVIGMPVLSATPKGLGGLIMNLHLDSNATILPIKLLYDMGLFKQGPYSIHITAGPDVDQFHDRQGLDVLHNAEVQNWIKDFVRNGHAIGSHGGWIHNYFGLNVTENNQDEFEKYLPLNINALKKTSGKTIVEYAAPVGNQPNWVTRYLESHGFIAYYTTSNTGVGATRNYRDGQFDKASLWSFPILPFGAYSAFEEFAQAHLSNEIVTDWLLKASRFVANHHNIRLIYYHPPGALGTIKGYPSFAQSITAWLAETKRLSEQGVFKWYTMTDVARFMDSRRNVQWNIDYNADFWTVSAFHPNSLRDQTWVMKKTQCQRPEILTGQAEVTEDSIYYLVSVLDGKSFKFRCKHM
jgi:hypothetical protein